MNSIVAFWKVSWMMNDDKLSAAHFFYPVLFYWNGCHLVNLKEKNIQKIKCQTNLVVYHNAMILKLSFR